MGDALEAGIKAGAANPAGPALLEGAQATLRRLHRAFDKAGIKVIDPAGQPFDPAWHEAMVAQESTEHPANTVLSVIQKGYSLNGRLLRPARVIVSKAGEPIEIGRAPPKITVTFEFFRGFSTWVR